MRNTTYKPLRLAALLLLGFALHGCSEESTRSVASNQQPGVAEPAPPIHTADGGNEVGEGTASLVLPWTVRAMADAEIRINETLLLRAELVARSVEPAAHAPDIRDLALKWSQLSGPAESEIEASQLLETSARFNTTGRHVLEICASHDTMRSCDTVVVTVQEALSNQTPNMTLSSLGSVLLGESLTLSASVTDDGLPFGQLNVQWSVQSGPGTATFSDPQALNTSVTLDAAGDWTLQAVADDGELRDTDTLNITVTEAGQSSTGQSADGSWERVISRDGSEAEARHEAGAVAWRNTMLLMGGRGSRQVQRFDPGTERWSNLGHPPMEISHFQPVLLNGKVYVIGAFGSGYPAEQTRAKVLILDPNTGQWSEGGEFPAHRRRGSAGTVVRNGKIYIVGGNTRGHDGGMVAWFDEYNPATNSWRTLPDAPHARDHFQAVLIDDKLIVAGGRRTTQGNVFGDTVAAVDIYDFDTARWSSAASIPTPRAGTMSVAMGSEMIVIGGESGAGAHDEVEAFSLSTRRWRSLDSLQQARHSGGAAVLDGVIHVVSGNTTKGGGHETRHHECLK